MTFNAQYITYFNKTERNLTITSDYRTFEKTFLSTYAVTKYVHLGAVLS